MRYFEKLKNTNNKYKINHMSVIVGTSDPITKYFNREVSHWSELAKNVDYIKINKGRHYFVQENVEELSEIIMNKLIESKELSDLNSKKIAGF